VNDPDSSIHEIAKIIEGDVAMSAKVLQLANSAFFGLAQKVTTLSNACSYLGMQTIKSLALASEAFRVLKPHSAHSTLRLRVYRETRTLRGRHRRRATRK